MMQPIHIVERSPVQGLQHALIKHDITLPDGFWEEALTEIIQAIMEIDVSQLIDASRYERNGTRRAYRNGYRESAWIVNGKNIPLRIPKLRSGTYYPSFLEDSNNEQVLAELVLRAYLHDIPIEALADTLDSLNVEAHISQIASLQETLYDLVEKYHQRTITTANVQLDLLPVDAGGYKSFLALAFNDDELLDHDLTIDADEEFWRDFVRRLDGRVIHGVEYVVVSRVHTVVRYARSNSPNMALVA